MRGGDRSARKHGTFGAAGDLERGLEPGICLGLSEQAVGYGGRDFAHGLRDEQGFLRREGAERRAASELAVGDLPCLPVDVAADHWAVVAGWAACGCGGRRGAGAREGRVKPQNMSASPASWPR